VAGLSRRDELGEIERIATSWPEQKPRRIAFIHNDLDRVVGLRVFRLFLDVPHHRAAPGRTASVAARMMRGHQPGPSVRRRSRSPHHPSSPPIKPTPRKRRRWCGTSRTAEDAETDYAIKVVVMKQRAGFCSGRRCDALNFPDFVRGERGRPPVGRIGTLFLWPVLHLWEFRSPRSPPPRYCLGGGTYFSLLTTSSSPRRAIFQMPLPQGPGCRARRR